ncbi:MAG TPA: 2-oxo acid dehydrogenase subunit E2 [Jatrophihabitans sp.]|nr:2-oxo acid dehydrogenase subunit E2 [Jatrophihabitans sp.]
MPELLRMPEVAANTTEAVLLSWPVPENVPFDSKDTIATVETAKAVVDIEAERAGIILRRLVTEGTEVAVGEPIALVALVDEVVPDVEAALTALGQSTEAKGAQALDIPEADPTPAAPVHTEATESTKVQPATMRDRNDPSPRLFASPLARRLARDAALPLDGLAGTGPNGRIVRKDVESAIRSRGGSPDRHGIADDARTESRGETTLVRVGAFVDAPLTRQRRLIATRLTHSKQAIPHFYVQGSARVDALLELRAELNQDAAVRVSVNDLVVKAVACTHRKVVALNVSYLDDVIRHYHEVDVAVAIATPAGLVTPVVRSADTRRISDLAGTLADYAARARTGQLRQHELEGGSITVTNLGMYGVEQFAAIINPPQASILAIGAARREPVIDASGGVSGARVIRMTLSVDHRAVDGAQAAEWLAAFIEYLERPVQILA